MLYSVACTKIKDVKLPPSERPVTVVVIKAKDARQAKGIVKRMSRDNLMGLEVNNAWREK